VRRNMNKTTLVLAGLLAYGAVDAACNIHDNTINATANLPNAMLNVTANTDVKNVTASQHVPLTVDAKNLFLVDPNDTPPPEHAADAVFLEFHLDVETDTPLLVTAETSVTVTIPAGTPPGPHKIICRVHKHDDGSPTNISFDVAINVIVDVHVKVDGGAPKDAGSAADAGAKKDAGTKKDGAAEAADNHAAPSTAVF
jgi:hypothetical protein